jgi:hypothetical protein
MGHGGAEVDAGRAAVVNGRGVAPFIGPCSY